MKVGTFGRTELRIHPLVFPILIAAIVLGKLGELLQASIALSLHELSHATAACAFGCPVPSVELMPFGGVARIGRDALPRRIEQPIALAGPISSFVAAGMTAACMHLFPQIASRLLPFFRFNLTLGLFNLLPAFPLDGGRVLRASLQRWLSFPLSTRITAWLGIFVGCALLGGFIWCAVYGAVNGTLLVMGIFLLIAAWNELRLLPDVRMGAYLARYDTLQLGKTYDVHVIAVNASMPVRQALSLLKQNRYNIFRVVDGSMHCVGELDEGDLMRALSKKEGTMPIGQLVGFDRRSGM